MPENRYRGDISQQNLEMVSHGLSETIQCARVALEEYIEDPGQQQILKKASEHLHVVQGVLRLVEIYGAALLVEEMEKVIAYLLESQRGEKTQTDSLEALSRSMVQLPVYLDRVINGGRDIALILLPLLNDLRSVRGRPLLSEGTLLLLNLTADRQTAPSPDNKVIDKQPDIREVAARQRPIFQNSLLGWIRGGDSDKELKILSEIAESLELAASNREVEQLWWVVGGAIEALSDQGLETSVSLKRLLGQVDRQIKRLVDIGEDGDGVDSSAELRNNLLYYIGRSTSNGKRVTAIQRAFKLDEILPGDEEIEQARESLSAPSVKLMKTVAAAIKEDLANVKDVLDIFVRTGMESLQELRPQAELLKKISDTLGVLGLGDLRALVMNETSRLQVLLSGDDSLAENDFLQMASALLQVEDNLDDALLRLILPTPKKKQVEVGEDADAEREFRQVADAVLRECLVNLARVKDAMTQALKHSEFQPMDQVPDLMRGVVSGLLILEKSRAVKQTEKINALIRKHVRPGLKSISNRSLDLLADAVVSIEYYLETLRIGRSDPWYMLDNIDDCLEALTAPDYTDRVPIIDESDKDATVVARPIRDLRQGEVKEQVQVAVEKLPVLDQKTNEMGEKLDPEFLELFIEEARDEILVIKKQHAIWRADTGNHEALRRMRRSYHTLKGSGRMVGASRIAEFSWAVENLMNRIIDGTRELNIDMTRLLTVSSVVLPDLVEELEVGRKTKTNIAGLMALAARLTEQPSDEPETEQAATDDDIGDATVVARQLGDLHQAADPEPAQDVPGPEMDPVLRKIFVKETTGHLGIIRNYLKACVAGAAPYPVTESLYRACHTLHGSAKMAGAMQGVKVAEPLDRFVRKLYDVGKGLDMAGIKVCQDVVASFDRIIKHLDEDTGFFPSHLGLIERLQELEAELDAEQSDVDAGKEIEPQAEEEEVEFDGEIASIFGEEAGELLDTAETALSVLRDDASDQTALAELKRCLHTLKGGARMAGIPAMGNLSHETESLLDMIGQDRLSFSDSVAKILQASMDGLHAMRETVSFGQQVASRQDLEQRIAGLMVVAGSDTREKAAQVSTQREQGKQPEVRHAKEISDDESVRPASVQPGASGPRAKAVKDQPAETMRATVEETVAEPPEEKDLSAAPVLQPASAAPMRKESPDRQEYTRVEADQLDEMLNLAGEISIYRSRLDQQMRSNDFHLAELSRTITRLRAQLRNMELETETQILHRHQKDSASSDFDPLELDRYSMIQQLSRALAESVNDVSSIKDLLENLFLESDSLLSQQARLTADLQSSLMQTRMVPFSRYEKRLDRIVRQTANEANKKAELRLEGASGELDRQVLERMLQPLEHILRNSVVHGIEDESARKAAGKPVTGDICIALKREGSEMMIRVSDDGAGIDAEKIRKKSIASGLLDASESMPSEQVLQMIFRPGFSTASEVTQTAGRGVGLDVVSTEVERLGGSVHAESTPGVGAGFVIRLPFTLAITQAMVVRVGDEFYALPLPTVEGIARMPRHQVNELLEQEDPEFEYGGRQYRLRHLAHFTGGHSTGFTDEELSVSIILVRAGSHSTALVADELLGSREIVVKSVGPQVAGISGISGGTILGDGSVALILDLGGLVRSDAARRRPQPIAPKEDTRTFVLVVDDSITVRRVTQRLLERNGMRVITARDGIDAEALLQEHTPDIILLDIEMPRMDGYELASRIRNDDRLAKIPIVMITSRTGEKHRARAIELGVNDYLGKPYQESQLLDSIEPLVAK
ncbi:MAG: Hpt domain-containing protein [Gammaproteobacteria bacterium]|nr:Hpt domain-containing protein [Gammaproteobacteria bacterium]